MNGGPPTDAKAQRRPASLWRPSGQSDGALGDWYVNRIVVDRRPLLLLISSTSLLPIVVPARDVRTLRDRLPDIVAAGLRRHGISERLVKAEARTMTPVVIAPTNNRSVVGILVDFAKALPYYLDSGVWRESDLPSAEALLAKTPCHAGKRAEQVIFPNRAAPDRLLAFWGAS